MKSLAAPAWERNTEIERRMERARMDRGELQDAHDITLSLKYCSFLGKSEKINNKITAILFCSRQN